MADFVYGQDRFFSEFEVTSSDNQLVINDPDDGEITASVSTGSSYFNHLDDGGNALHGSAFLKALETAINSAATTNTYTIASNTPSGSDLTKSGISISSTGGDFTLKFSDASTTIDPRWIGWGESQSSDVGAANPVQSPFSLYPVWQSHNQLDNAATDKRKIPHQNIQLSGDDVQQAARKKFLERDRRLFRYEWIFAGHVKENRATDQKSADNAGLPQGDVHNAFELFWRAATEGDENEKLVRIVIVHDRGGEGYENVYDDDHEELVRLADADQIRSADDIIDDMNMAGEYYSIAFLTDIEDGEYDQ